MNQVRLVTYGKPKPAFITVQGRSGVIYDKAAYNPDTNRHETKPFDLKDYHERILPDLAKAVTIDRNIRWFVVVELDETAKNVAELEDAIDKAKAEIASLKSQLEGATNAQSEPPKEEEPSDPSVEQGGELGVRAIRAKLKELNVTIPPNQTREQLLALLEEASKSNPSEPVVPLAPPAE